MSRSDDTTRPGDVPFVQVGVGLTMARSCGKCGKRSTRQEGSSRHKILGWLGPCCTKVKPK